VAIAMSVVGEMLHLASLLNAGTVPHLNHEFCEPPWKVVVDDAHASNCLNSAMEELTPALEFNFSSEERAQQFQERKTCCVYHLQDVI
jgi:hypothetical protein